MGTKFLGIRNSNTEEKNISNLEGKIALVTGAGRGVGAALGKRLATAGASVVVNDLDQGPAEETVREIVQNEEMLLHFAEALQKKDLAKPLWNLC